MTLPNRKGERSARSPSAYMFLLPQCPCVRTFTAAEGIRSELEGRAIVEYRVSFKLRDTLRELDRACAPRAHRAHVVAVHVHADVIALPVVHLDGAVAFAA